MSFLTPDRVWGVSVAGRELTVNQRIIPDSARSPRKIAAHIPAGGRIKPGKLLGGDGRPRGVTIHNTCDIATPPGTNPAEQYSRATWPNANMRGVVVHFYIWRREIWQNLALDEQGWHAGDGITRRESKRPGERVGGNVDTIAIEVIGEHPESIQTAAMLSAWLLRENNLSPETDLYTHNFFMGLPERIVQGARKNCPLFILPEWEGFRQTVGRYCATLNPNTSGKLTKPPEKNTSSYRPISALPLKKRLEIVEERYSQLRWELAELADRWPVD